MSDIQKYVGRRYAEDGEERVQRALCRVWMRRHPNVPLRPERLLRLYDEALTRIALAATESQDRVARRVSREELSQHGRAGGLASAEVRRAKA